MADDNPLDIIFWEGESPGPGLKKKFTSRSLAAFKQLCKRGCRAGTLDFLLSCLASGSEPALHRLDELHSALDLSEKHYKKKPDRVRRHLEEISKRAVQLVQDILDLRETMAVQELGDRHLIGKSDLLYSRIFLDEDADVLLADPPKPGEPDPHPNHRLLLAQDQPPRRFPNDPNPRDRSRLLGGEQSPEDFPELPRQDMDIRLRALFYGLANLPRLLKELGIGEQKWPDRRQQRIDLHKYVRESTGHWNDALLADILANIWPEGGTVNKSDRPTSKEGVKRWRHRHGLKG